MKKTIVFTVLPTSIIILFLIGLFALSSINQESKMLMFEIKASSIIILIVLTISLAICMNFLSHYDKRVDQSRKKRKRGS